MYRVRTALVPIFSVHCEYFRALEVKQYVSLMEAKATFMINGTAEKETRTHRNRDFIDVAKVGGPYKVWRHVLGINNINCYCGCGGQHLMLSLVFSTSILRQRKGRKQSYHLV